MDHKELFLMVDAISNEKNITEEDVFIALEQALTTTTKKKRNFDAEVKIDRKTGAFRTFRLWLVVEDGESFVDDDGTEFDQRIHIYEKDADGLLDGAFVSEEIDTEEFGRIEAQAVKQGVFQKVREVANQVIVNSYLERIGEVIMVTVKRFTNGNVIVDLGGSDGMISKRDLIPNESFRKSERLRVYIKDVKLSSNGRAQVFLSRTVPEMVTSLFEMEVPEISEGVIEIMGVSREAGFRSKVAVRAKDKRIDPVGACIGMRGSRIQAVTNELNGEHIDLVVWDEDPVQYLMNAMNGVEIKSIIIDEDENSMEVSVDDDQLALAIGRRGQNIRLSSKLIGWDISVISVDEALENEKKVENGFIDKLSDQLGVSREVTGVLYDEGFRNVDDIVEAGLDLSNNLDEYMVSDIQERALDAQMVLALSNGSIVEDLVLVEGIDEDMALALIDSEVNSIDGVAELSVVELISILEYVTEEIAGAVIISARKQQGWI